jgi:hypothetical protein
MGVPRDNDVVRLANALGVPVSGGFSKVNAAFATAAVTAAQDGEMFIGAVDAVITLPAMTAALKGVTYKAKCGSLSAGTGLSLSPAAADGIGGAGLTRVVDKDLINSGATDTINDFVVVRGTGISGSAAWDIVDIQGIWAKEG